MSGEDQVRKILTMCRDFIIMKNPGKKILFTNIPPMMDASNQFKSFRDCIRDAKEKPKSQQALMIITTTMPQEEFVHLPYWDVEFVINYKSGKVICTGEGSAKMLSQLGSVPNY